MSYDTVDDYLEATGTTGKEFAASLGISEPVLSAIRTGKTKVKPELAAKMEAKTKGALEFRAMTFQHLIIQKRQQERLKRLIASLNSSKQELEDTKRAAKVRIGRSDPVW